MTDMYEAGELLDHIQRVVDKAGDKTIVQTPDGKDPVYWPYTVHGRAGMMQDSSRDGSDSHPAPREKSPASAKGQQAQTSDSES